MSERTSVVNISGDHEETIIQLAKHLGTSKIRRKIFNTIYGRGTRARSKKQIIDAAKIQAKGANIQQVQNELDHLCKHHLIMRVENTGSVKDKSRYLYQKDPTVRANKERIIRLADDRNAATKIATKRSPIIRASVSIRSVTKASLRKRRHLNVLYLTANPDAANPLRVDLEVRRVQEAIRGSRYRDSISVEYRPAADLNSLIDGLNDLRPQIVHFSGHGYNGGIVGDSGKPGKSGGQIISFALLKKALSATDSPPQIVILNSCDSSTARTALIPPVEIIVAMQTSITDPAASAFAVRFYAAIASGQSVKAAFAQGQVAVEATSIHEADIPELIYTPPTNPSKLVLT